jgi:hypothetical protein
MKNLTYFILTLSLISCQDLSFQNPTVADAATVEVKEFEHDGCEYISINNGRRFGVSHKGNCKNHNILDGRTIQDKVDAVKKEESLLGKIITTVEEHTNGTD